MAVKQCANLHNCAQEREREREREREPHLLERERERDFIRKQCPYMICRF